MVKTYRLDIWSKDTKGVINCVLSILYDQERKLEIGGGIIEGVQSVPNYTPSPEIIAKWEGEPREVAARVEGAAVFTGGMGFMYQSECEYFASDHTPEGKFQWFIYIVR